MKFRLCRSIYISNHIKKLRNNLYRYVSYKNKCKAKYS